MFHTKEDILMNVSNVLAHTVNISEVYNNMRPHLLLLYLLLCLIEESHPSFGAGLCEN